MKHAYRLYDLKINSEIPLIGYSNKKIYKHPDVTIQLGKVVEPPSELPNTLYKPLTVINSDFYYQDIPDIAKYYVEGKNKVVIEPYANAHPIDKSVFFRSAILPILLARNNIFLLKASAVNIDNEIYVFCSTKGNGLSSLAATLCLAHGAKLVSEGLTYLKWDAEKKCFTSKCEYPHVDLWRDMFPLFKKRRKKYKKAQIRKDILKFRCDFSKHASKKAYPVKAVYTVVVENDFIDCKATPVKGIIKAQTLKAYTLASNSSKLFNKEKELFKFNGLISKHLPLTQINRSKAIAVNQFAKFILDEIHPETT